MPVFFNKKQMETPFIEDGHEIEKIVVHRIDGDEGVIVWEAWKPFTERLVAEGMSGNTPSGYSVTYNVPTGTKVTSIHGWATVFNHLPKPDWSQGGGATAQVRSVLRIWVDGVDKGNVTQSGVSEAWGQGWAEQNSYYTVPTEWQTHITKIQASSNGNSFKRGAKIYITGADKGN